MNKPHYSTGDLIIFLEKYLPREFEQSYREYYTGEICTVKQHSFCTLSLFDNNRFFNGIEFPDSIICREHFRILLALHDIGMADYKSDVDVKYGSSVEYIQWLLSQSSFRKNFEFSSQEERIALALVSSTGTGDPLWRYLAQSKDVITTAEIIGIRAYKAGIEIESDAFYTYYLHEIIYFMCDAGSYANNYKGPVPYVEIDNLNRKLNFTKDTEKQINELGKVIVQMTIGAIPFSSHNWKPVKYKHLTDYARRNRAELRSGKILRGSDIQYRFNGKTGYYELQPNSIPFLYDPNY